MTDKPKKLKIALSSGDPNGIGLELILKTFSDPTLLSFCMPVVYANLEALRFYSHLLDTAVDIRHVTTPDDAKDNVVNVINCWENSILPVPGKAETKGGKCAFASLEKAMEDVMKGKVDVLVTGPINKDLIQSDSFNFPGHTEYLSSKTGGEKPLMLMCSGQLKIGVVTGHIPVNEIANVLSQNLILEKLEVMHQALRKDFGISAPKIAVLGLNPHAGDNGLLGKEEQTIIGPAISKANKKDIDAIGPISADGFFGSQAYLQYDGILAMYHDQGLIPFKALSFGKGVNFTAGIPIIRTSPDHGVAYDLAGKNIASHTSYQAAVQLAMDLANYTSR